MKHLDLFSGIGGASLAADAVWPDMEHIFVEIDHFCQQVLKKHWPNAQIYGDIRTLTAYPKHDESGINSRTVQGKNEKTGREASGSLSDGRDSAFDLLTGGFPCQPFSQAGRRKGTSDDRFLWPEMLRVIREFKPRWVVGENVAGLLTIEQGLVFEQVCADLEKEGYEVQPFIIPAVAVNAPHRRDRVWIVAHRISAGAGGKGGTLGNEERRTSEGGRTGIRQAHGQIGAGGVKPTVSNDSHSPSIGRDNGVNNRQGRHIPLNERTAEKGEPQRDGRERRTGEVGADASDASEARGRTRDGQEIGGRKKYEQKGNGFRINNRASGGAEWDKNWLEVATELCRMDDGLSARLVGLPDGRKISYSKWRQEALKGLGNAWVPQIAQEIFKAIKEIEKNQ